MSRDPVIQDSELLALPDEILINVFTHLEHQDLLLARSVCTHFQTLAEPTIYRQYEIGRGSRSRRLAYLLNDNPKRASWLRSILVSTRFEEAQGLEDFPNQLQKMQNLKHLVLETPDCNAKSPEDRLSWIGLQRQYESIFSSSTLSIPSEKRVLGKLESCVMHFVDTEKSLYPLTQYSSIFLHPTLKSLTLSCACTDVPKLLFPDHDFSDRITALENLHLEECDVDPKSLELLLRLPKALKSFKLSEGTRYDEGWGNRAVRKHGNVTPGAISNALTCSVGDSLETLSLSLGYRNRVASMINHPGRALDLRSMSCLKHLSLAWTTLTLVYPRTSCDHELYRRLPPSIETLQVFSIPLIALRGGPIVPLSSCVYKRKAAHGLPNLNKIIYTYEYQTPLGRSNRAIIDRPHADLVGQIIAACKTCVRSLHSHRYPMYKKYGVRVVIEMEATPPGFIPPYLNNEEHPVTTTYWDSADVVDQAVEPPGSTQEENEASDREDSDEIVAQGRRISQLVPRMEDLLNLLIMQPGHGF